MKNTIIKISLIAVFLFLISNLRSQSDKIPESFKPNKSNSISFTENKGQVSDQYYKPRPDVLFSGTDGYFVYHIKNNGISYQLNRVDTWKNEEDERTKEKRKVADQTTIYRLDVSWVNANLNAKIEKEKALKEYNNYYLPTCASGALNVRSYQEITYQQIYKGIDLKWYSKNGHLKYDYIVAAGSNYKQIQLEIKGAQKITINPRGELVIKTPLGELIEQAPLVFQSGKTLKAKWIIKNNIVSFDIENIDTNKNFIIDPAVRVWGTYYGGPGNEFEGFCRPDASGNVYLSGYTNSSFNTFISTIGSFQNSLGGSNDAFLVKFDASGTRLWGTYYGDVADDRGFSCATDIFGNVFLMGQTTSSGTVIATVGAHQTSPGGSGDSFLAKFNSSGVRQWGTYYGGNTAEFCYSCCTDQAGNVFLTGGTSSATGTAIATVGSHQPIFGGTQDDFLVKFNGSGVRQWGTYYGGAGNDFGYSCCTDPFGNVYLSGTTSTNTGTVIATSGSHQSTLGGASNDAFLAKFNSLGVRKWATYYGDVGAEVALFCSSDISGNIILCGNTTSSTSTIIATAGSHQSLIGGGQDAFVVKFDSIGVRQWGTYYGSVGNESTISCALDPSGNIFISGSAPASTVIATVGAHQTAYGGGSQDGYLVKFNSSGVRQWGTYYGGSGIDYGRICATDGFSNVFLAGHTDSNNGTSIATVGSHQATLTGGAGIDDFLVKFADCPAVQSGPLDASVNTPVCSTGSFSLSALGYGTIGWFLTATGGTAIATGTTYITPTLTNTTTYYAQDSSGCGVSPRTAITVTINPNPTVTAVSNNSLICTGQTATLTASGANTYTWNPGGAGTSISVSPTITTNYTLTGTNANGCQNVTTITQSVSACTGLVPSSFEKAGDEAVSIYPNPNNGEFSIIANLNTEIIIINELGQAVKTISLNKNNGYQLAITGLANGIYFIVGNNIKQKLVVLK